MHGFDSATYGFETAKDILGVGPNTMAKLIDLNLVSADGANQRNQQYSGWDIGYLASARNNPLTIGAGQKALVCSMGVEEHEARPSLYFDATWARYSDVLDEVRRNVSEDIWAQIMEGSLRVTGHWRVSQEDTDFLVDNKSIVVASYAGFILDGGHIEEWVPNVFSKSGGRCFVVRPFDHYDRNQFAHNYLLSRPGPMNKVWTSEELAEEAARPTL
uniref:hypothetical protein n=1 Tax=Tessaracoccus timonensis TaxID=2161816 RepID=UPI000D558692|nr:hypothetical protein [Tessaracoccus timonensis]